MLQALADHYREQGFTVKAICDLQKYTRINPVTRRCGALAALYDAGVGGRSAAQY